jgi:hypothetical protein
MPNAIGTNAIGPSFAAELAAAGLAGLPFSWGADGEFTFAPRVGGTEQASILAVYAAHDPTHADPNAAFSAAVAAGLAITSTGSPAISGTYGCSAQDQLNVVGLQSAVVAGVFPGFYRTLSGTRVTMTGAQFTEIATAILGYVEALDAALSAGLASGGVWVAPTATATIA